MNGHQIQLGMPSRRTLGPWKRAELWIKCGVAEIYGFDVLRSVVAVASPFPVPGGLKICGGIAHPTTFYRFGRIEKERCFFFELVFI